MTVTGTDALGLVNPFIGSQEDGNTYPGATVPFGMVQLSPDTGHNTGYDYTQSSVRGFSLTHMSGVGCGIDGFVPVTPATSQPSSTDYADGGYARSFKKDGSGKKVEAASPGLYTATVQSGTGNDIAVELTATERTGLQRYTFATTGTTASYVRVNPGQALSTVTASEVHVDLATGTVRTRSDINGFCQNTLPFSVWTTTKFATPIESATTWTGSTLGTETTSGTVDAVNATGRTGVSLKFAHNATVEFQSALSYASAAGADANLAAETETFDAAKTAAQATWAAQLGKVQVTQGDLNAGNGDRQTQLRVFYSALYRSFLAPNLGSDVDGSYRGWDGDVHNTADTNAGLTDYYQNFSLWDTYRTQEQWLYLTEPKRASDMAKSLVLQSEQSGWLPRWGYGPVETNTMTGDPGTPFLVTAWDQGLLDGGWAERAYAVLKHNADSTPNKAAFQNGRAGNPVYLEDGYVPFNTAAKSRNTDYDLDHGGSATLEYALADATLSHMAAGLGHTEDAARYALRGQNFRSLWDPDNNLFRTRDASGAYLTETDPAQIDGFHEGTSAQYTWLVQQDVPSLISLLGGKSAAENRLDTFFAYDDIDLENHPGQVAHNAADPVTGKDNPNWWVSGTYGYYGYSTYNPNNEPDLHSPYIYLWLGKPSKTTDVVREALTLFTDSPNGVTGNDDLGTMAAWQVLSTIGIYPIMPGSNTWGLTTPVFDKVTIDLDQTYFHGTDKLVITAQGVSPENRYTQSVKVSGAAEPKAYVTGDELTSAGTLDFTVGATPSSWATTDADTPGSLVPAPALPTRLVVSTPGGRTVVPAGGSASTTVSVQLTGTQPVSGELRADAWSGISVTYPQGSSANLSPRGGTVMRNVPVTVSADASVKPGSYPVTWTFGSGADAVTATTLVSVPDVSPLAATGAFNNKAFGDRDNGSSAKFNASVTDANNHEYFLRDIATKSGMPLGVHLQHPSDPSLDYVLSDSGAGSSATAYDNIIAKGQTTDLTGKLPGATKIAFIVSANNGNVLNQTATLTFSDSSTLPVSISASDWCGWETTGNTGSGRASERYANGPQNLACGLYATVPVSLGGKTLTSITWPSGTDAGRLHIFAIASDSGVKATGTASVAGATAYAPGATLTATAPTFTVPGASTVPTVSYQWLRDGAPIAGADAAVYTLTPQDAGADLSVVVTGQVASLAPATVTSSAVSITPGTYTVTAVPTVSGTPKVGQRLTVTPGTYSVPDVAETYQWLADGSPVAGAVDSSLLLDASLVGKRISVTVSSSKTGYTSAEPTTTAATAPVAASAAPVIGVTKAPVVSGKAKVGKTLTATPGAYSVPGVTVSYQWLRAGVSVKGATLATYTPVKADKGRQLSVRVTATKTGYTTVAATSPTTPKVKAGTIKVTKKAKIKGKAKVGKKLKVTKGTYKPAGKTTIKVRWLRGSKKIKGATSKRYKVKAADRGKKLKAKVIVKKPGYAKKKYTTKKTTTVH